MDLLPLAATALSILALIVAITAFITAHRRSRQDQVTVEPGAVQVQVGGRHLPNATEFLMMQTEQQQKGRHL